MASSSVIDQGTAEIVEDIPSSKTNDSLNQNSEKRLSDQFDTSFTSQKTTDLSFTSAASRINSADDTFTTADFESAGEEDLEISAFGNSDPWFQSLEYDNGNLVGRTLINGDVTLSPVTHDPDLTLQGSSDSSPFNNSDCLPLERSDFGTVTPIKTPRSKLSTPEKSLKIKNALKEIKSTPKNDCDILPCDIPSSANLEQVDCRQLDSLFREGNISPIQSINPGFNSLSRRSLTPKRDLRSDKENLSPILKKRSSLTENIINTIEDTNKLIIAGDNSDVKSVDVTSSPILGSKENHIGLKENVNGENIVTDSSIIDNFSESKTAATSINITDSSLTVPSVRIEIKDSVSKSDSDAIKTETDKSHCITNISSLTEKEIVSTGDTESKLEFHFNKISLEEIEPDPKQKDIIKKEEINNKSDDQTAKLRPITDTHAVSEKLLDISDSDLRFSFCINNKTPFSKNLPASSKLDLLFSVDSEASLFEENILIEDNSEIDRQLNNIQIPLQEESFDFLKVSDSNASGVTANAISPSEDVEFINKVKIFENSVEKSEPVQLDNSNIITEKASEGIVNIGGIAGILKETLFSQKHFQGCEEESGEINSKTLKPSPILAEKYEISPNSTFESKKLLLEEDQKQISSIFSDLSNTGDKINIPEPGKHILKHISLEKSVQDLHFIDSTVVQDCEFENFKLETTEEVNKGQLEVEAPVNSRQDLFEEDKLLKDQLPKPEDLEENIQSQFCTLSESTPEEENLANISFKSEKNTDNYKKELVEDNCSISPLVKGGFNSERERINQFGELNLVEIKNENVISLASSEAKKTIICVNQEVDSIDCNQNTDAIKQEIISATSDQCKLDEQFDYFVPDTNSYPVKLEKQALSDILLSSEDQKSNLEVINIKAVPSVKVSEVDLIRTDRTTELDCGIQHFNLEVGNIETNQIEVGSIGIDQTGEVSSTDQGPNVEVDHTGSNQTIQLSEVINLNVNVSDIKTNQFDILVIGTNQSAVSASVVQSLNAEVGNIETNQLDIGVIETNQSAKSNSECQVFNLEVGSSETNQIRVASIATNKTAESNSGIQNLNLKSDNIETNQIEFSSTEANPIAEVSAIDQDLNIKVDNIGTSQIAESDSKIRTFNLETHQIELSQSAESNTEIQDLNHFVDNIQTGPFTEFVKEKSISEPPTENKSGDKFHLLQQEVNSKCLKLERESQALLNNILSEEVDLNSLDQHFCDNTQSQNIVGENTNLTLDNIDIVASKVNNFLSNSQKQDLIEIKEKHETVYSNTNFLNSEIINETDLNFEMSDSKETEKRIDVVFESVKEAEDSSTENTILEKTVIQQVPFKSSMKMSSDNEISTDLNESQDDFGGNQTFNMNSLIEKVGAINLNSTFTLDKKVLDEADECESNGSSLLDNLNNMTEDEVTALLEQQPSKLTAGFDHLNLPSSFSLEMKPDLNTTEAGPMTAADDIQSGELSQLIPDTDDDISALKRKVDEMTDECIIRDFDPLADLPTSSKNHLNSSLFNMNKESGDVEVQVTPFKDDHVGLLIPITPLPDGSPKRSKMHHQTISLIDSSGNFTILNSTEKEDANCKVDGLNRTALPVTPKSSKNLVAQMNQKESPVQVAIAKELSNLQEVSMERMRLHEIKVKELLGRIAEAQKRKENNEATLKKLRTKMPYVQKLEEAKKANTKYKSELSVAFKQSSELLKVVSIYEKTMREVLNNSQSEKNILETEVNRMLMERDTAKQHVTNMEMALNDIHMKHERSVKLIEEMVQKYNKKKEELRDRHRDFKMAKENYIEILGRATYQLEDKNKEWVEIMRKRETEVEKNKALIEQQELKIKNNELTIKQKQKELCEMRKIYEDLLRKLS